MLLEQKLMKSKLFGIISLLSLILTVIWLALFIYSTASKGTANTLDQAIAQYVPLDTVTYLSYLNAALLTLSVTALFAGVYLYCRKSNPGLALIGIIFIPIYCALNVFCYLSQITIVPALAAQYSSPAYHDAAGLLLGQLIQSWNGSLVMVLNNLAYAILGLPSIAFGWVLLKQQGKYAKYSGILLILNALACIMGFIGILANNKLISIGSIIGGVIFILALVTLTVMFFKEADQ